jgi:hypothetical protein
MDGGENGLWMTAKSTQAELTLSTHMRVCEALYLAPFNKIVNDEGEMEKRKAR